jgi:hypothetical protein
VNKYKQQRYDATLRDGLPPHVEHGANAYMNWGCRCAVCKKAYNKPKPAWQKGRFKALVAPDKEKQ